jgi:hypothetical protein
VVELPTVAVEPVGQHRAAERLAQIEILIERRVGEQIGDERQRSTELLPAPLESLVLGLRPCGIAGHDHHQVNVGDAVDRLPHRQAPAYVDRGVPARLPEVRRNSLEGGRVEPGPKGTQRATPRAQHDPQETDLQTISEGAAQAPPSCARGRGRP